MRDDARQLLVDRVDQIADWTLVYPVLLAAPEALAGDLRARTISDTHTRTPVHGTRVHSTHVQVS